MFFSRWFYFSFLLFITFSSISNASHQSVTILHDFLSPLEKDTLLTSPVYGPLKDLLKAKNLSLSASSVVYYQQYTDTDTTAYIVFCNLPSFINFSTIQKQIPKEKLILFMWEPPTVQPWLYDDQIKDTFGRIYTWDDDLIDDQLFFKFYYPVLLSMRNDLVPFKNRKLCTLINSNKISSHQDEIYSEREKTIQFFEKYHPDEFTFYGYGWERKGYKTYSGTTPDKIKTLLNYRFCICYENISTINGYITEKIFDCFAAGCIPVYLGAPNVAEYIPKECFIDRRDFDSDEEVYTYLHTMEKEDYMNYLGCIKQFLNSKQALKFSSETFANIFNNAILSN